MKDALGTLTGAETRTGSTGVDGPAPVEKIAEEEKRFSPKLN